MDFLLQGLYINGANMMSTNYSTEPIIIDDRSSTTSESSSCKYILFKILCNY